MTCTVLAIILRLLMPFSQRLRMRGSVQKSELRIQEGIFMYILNSDS